MLMSKCGHPSTSSQPAVTSTPKSTARAPRSGPSPPPLLLLLLPLLLELLPELLLEPPGFEVLAFYLEACGTR